jgi:hypothetical protein
MTTVLQLSGLLIFLALWGMAWRREPSLALGITFGVALAVVVTVVFRPFEIHQVPIWLPPLPFAAVALSLLGFGIWAWRVGRQR